MKKINYFALLVLTLLPLCVGAQGLSVFGDYLYWNASEQTDSVWANAIGAQGNQITYALPNVKFNSNSGYKVGIKYDLPQLWSVRLAWTHLLSNKSDGYTANANQIITPEFFSGYLSSDIFNSATINWQINMKTIDFDISHPLKITRTLSISPSIGVKSAAINQTINTGFNEVIDSFPIYSSTEIVKNNYTGIGPSFGVDANWNFYGDFSFVGDFATALMWGRWNINDTYSRPSALFGLISPKTITTSLNNSKLGTAMFDYFLGVEWSHKVIAQMNFFLGYQMQYWPNQLRAPTFQLLPLHGDLTYQGLTCGISLGF
jgi:hypothetical protein